MDSSSQSWWSESVNRPKHSKWLQENLSDVDTNVQTMLKLIEGEADSFAQRAEMYYKKRPELLKVVEQFYRGYRALAERYDQLTGSVRQIPVALQAQYGIHSESPRSSPFGKQASFRKSSNSLKEPSGNFSEIYRGDASPVCDEDGEIDGSSVNENLTRQIQDAGDETASSTSSCSDAESDNSNQDLFRLRQLVASLQSEKKTLHDKAKERIQQQRDVEKKLHVFREDFLRTQKENNTLKMEVAGVTKVLKELEEEVKELREQKEEFKCEVNVLKEESENKKEYVKRLEERVESLRIENEKLRNEVKASEDAIQKAIEYSEVLKVRVNELKKENEEQINEFGEEKREVIRQLCFSLNMMNDKNELLKTKLTKYQQHTQQHQHQQQQHGSIWGNIFSATSSSSPSTAASTS